MFGEGAVIRILDSGNEIRDINSLELNEKQLETVRRFLDYREGFVLATGPTGSGKTTSLYALLQELNKPDHKIITLEDPVENHLDGVTQINVHFKNRAYLCQGPAFDSAPGSGYCFGR